MATYDSTTKDAKCIFCEIIAGNMKTPGVFWENQEFIAWLSIDPNTEGFCCSKETFWKRHIENAK